MLSRFSSIQLHPSILNQVCSSLSSFFLKYHLHIASSTFTVSSLPSNSSNKSHDTHLDLPLLTVPQLGKSVLSKYYDLLNPPLDSVSLNELLLNMSHISPQTSRKFLRFSSLKPEHVLGILVGFRLPLDVTIVGYLWELFKRASDENEGFKHLPESYDVMASLLISAGMLREVESLLSSIEIEGVLVVSDGVFNGMIEKYVSCGELDNAMLLYDKMKGHDRVPSISCYTALIDLLLKECKAVEVLGIYEELIEVSSGFVNIGPRQLETLIKLLCGDGKIREARKFLKKIVTIGCRPSVSVLNEVASLYLQKKDFEDIVNFFVEMKSFPDILVGNKIIFSLCRHFGVERGCWFLWELEKLGFKPNEVTFGILISWSCFNGNLKGAFLYLSENLQRGLKPDRHSYNALISGLFKAGVEQHAADVFNEMIDNGIEPDLTTFKTLLSGYSLSRRFSEVKLVVSEMVNRSSMSMSPIDDPISQAFSILGLSPFAVKVRRDNNTNNFRTEFVDELGNGLYLDTNLDEFDKTLSGVLEESLVPDFNLLVMRQCDLKNLETALLLVDEMIHWGQELSVSVLRVLIRLVCASKSNMKVIPPLLDKMPEPFSQLDYETLNLLLKSLSKEGFAENCCFLADEMQRKHLLITNATYAAILLEFCKTGNPSDLSHFWHLAYKGNWLPDMEEFVTISDWLCERKMLKELLELFDILLVSNADAQLQICTALVEKLCCGGFTCVAHILVNELQKKHIELDYLVYSHLVKGYCREKRFSEAQMIFETIQDGDMAVISEACLLLIPQLCKLNRTEEVVKLKNAYLRDHPTNTLSLYIALIDGFYKARKIAEVDTLFNELISKNVLPTDEIYNTMLQGHSQLSYLKRIMELLCLMIKHNITFSLSSYRDLIRLMCRNKRFHSALSLKKIMHVGSEHPISIMNNILTFYFFSMGNCSMVYSLLNDLKATEMQLDHVGYNILVYGFSKCKDMSRSMEYLNVMISKGFRPSNRNLRSVMRYLCSNGQVDSALQLSDLINTRGWILCSTVQHALVTCLLSRGRIHEAITYLNRIMETCLIPDSINYDNLIKMFCQCGQTETAVSLLDQMLKKKNMPDSTSYDCIIQNLCTYNHLNQAMNFYAEMMGRNLRPSIGTWDLLIEKFCETGQTPEAERLLISMVVAGETPTRKMYYTVVDRFRLEKNLSKASKLLRMMQKHGCEPDFQIQWSLISSLSNSNEHDGNGTRGFLSKLLSDSGFLSQNSVKP